MPRCYHRIDMSVFPYNRAITQTSTSLNIPPRLSHLPPSLAERPSMVEFNAAIQAQQIHSTDGFSMDQDSHPVIYDQQYTNNPTSMYSQNASIRQTTGIYPPNPNFSLHTQIYTPSERLLPFLGDTRQDMATFSNYRNNFFHQPSNTNYGHQIYPQMGTTERQDICTTPRDAGRNLHLGLSKQSGMNATVAICFLYLFSLFQLKCFYFTQTFSCCCLIQQLLLLLPICLFHNLHAYPQDP